MISHNFNIAIFGIFLVSGMLFQGGVVGEVQVQLNHEIGVKNVTFALVRLLIEFKCSETRNVTIILQNYPMIAMHHDFLMLQSMLSWRHL